MLADELQFFLACLLAGLSVGISVFHAMPWFDAMIQKRIGSLHDTVMRLGMDMTWVPLAMRLWFVCLVAIPSVVVFVMQLGPVVVPVVFLIWNAPVWILQRWITIRKRTYRDQMIPMCVSLANAARSGLSLPTSFEEIQSETKYPLRNEVSRIVQEYRRGRSIVEAIRDTQARLQLDHFNIFTSVMLTCYDTGANYTIVLDKMSHALMENQRLERKLLSDTASGRYVVFLLSMFPSFFLIMFFMLSPEMVHLLIWTAYGQISIVVAMAINYISIRIAMRYLAIRI